jgi:hypothetical protein
MRPHQFLNLLPVPHEGRRAILQRRRGAVALAECLCGWIAILAPQPQFPELLAYHDRRQPGLLSESRLVGPHVGKFLTTLLSHEGNFQSCLYYSLHWKKRTHPKKTRASWRARMPCLVALVIVASPPGELRY